MSEFVENPRLTDFLKSEGNGGISREVVTVLAGSGADRALKAGTVIGKRTKTGAVGAAVAGNTGNGVLGAVTLGQKAIPGIYNLRAIEAATNAGQFELSDPQGDVVGLVTVAVAFVSEHMSFTLADGATDFAVDDKFTITVGGSADGKVIALAPVIAATGYIQFNEQPAVNDTITLDGQAITFVASGATADQVNIGQDVLETINNTVTVLNGHADAGIVLATYSSNGYNQVIITHDTPGTGGNAWTLTKSGVNLAVSGATLTGGAGSLTDGSQEAYGIIGENVTAPNGVDKKSFAIVRDAVISDAGLVFATGVLTAEQTTAINQLEAKGIIVRQGV